MNRLLPLTMLAGWATPLLGQAPPSTCHWLCEPSVSLMPALIRTHLFGGPLVLNTSTSAQHRLPSTSNVEMIVAASATTLLPRLSAFGTVQWLPNASEQRNPFTLYTANDVGGELHANAPTATLGLSLAALTAGETRGWFDIAVNAGSLFSQAARPSDRSSYTPKLDLDLVTHWHAFSPLPPKTWGHGVSVFAILDYVATGLPRTGDEVPKGRRYLDDARPTALIAGLSLPLTTGGNQ